MRPANYLYNLVPRFNRSRDLAEGSPLRALFTLLQAQYDLIEDDIGTLYSNWFVESCEDWALPYIGDLIGGTGIGLLSHPGADVRRLVANTMSYRRGSGLAATLERIAEDVTGWPVRVHEWRDMAAATGNVQQIDRRVGFAAIGDARDGAFRPDDPFGDAPRNAAIRPNGMAPGRVAICVWRRPVFRLEEAVALPRPDGGYLLHPLGVDSPLFQAPAQRLGIAQRRDEDHSPAFFDGARDYPAFALRVTPVGSATAETVPAERILLADLRSWRQPNGLRPDHHRAVLDVQRGRMLLLHPQDRLARVETDHIYAAPAAIGGGAYHRPPAAAAKALPVIAMVAARTDAPAGIVADPSEALALWQTSGGDGIVEFADSAPYAPPAGQSSWEIALDGDHPRILTLKAEDGRRPCLVGDLRIRANRPGHRFVLDGMMIHGCIHLEGAVEVVLHHSTVMAGRHRSALSGEQPVDGHQHLQILSSIVGPLRLPGQKNRVEIVDSIVDGCGLRAVAADPHQDAAGGHNRRHGPYASFQRSTVWGETAVNRLEARDTLFAHPVLAESDMGEVSHCCLPAESRTPPQVHCVTLGMVEATRTAGPFRTVRYGNPDYFRLAAWAPAAIAQAASDGGEIGAFNQLAEHQCRLRLREALDEYFPVGLHPVVVELS